MYPCVHPAQVHVTDLHWRALRRTGTESSRQIRTLCVLLSLLEGFRFFSSRAAPMNIDRVRATRAKRKQQEKQEKEIAARHIQATVRGGQSRRRVLSKRENDAAIRIQARQRQRVAAQILADMQLLHDITESRRQVAAVHLQRKARGWLARRERLCKQKQITAALTIARASRRFLRRHALRKAQDELTRKRLEEKQRWEQYSKNQKEESAKLRNAMEKRLKQAKKEEDERNAKEAEHHRRRRMHAIRRENARREAALKREIEQHEKAIHEKVQFDREVKRKVLQVELDKLQEEHDMIEKVEQQRRAAVEAKFGRAMTEHIQLQEEAQKQAAKKYSDAENRSDMRKNLYSVFQRVRLSRLCNLRYIASYSCWFSMFYSLHYGYHSMSVFLLLHQIDRNRDGRLQSSEVKQLVKMLGKTIGKRELRDVMLEMSNKPSDVPLSAAEKKEKRRMRRLSRTSAIDSAISDGTLVRFKAQAKSQKEQLEQMEIDFEAFVVWWEQYGREGKGVLSTVIARKTSVMAGQMDGLGSRSSSNCPHASMTESERRALAAQQFVEQLDEALVLQAATNVQRWTRGYLLRLEFRTMLRQQQSATEAATVIQTRWRGSSSRKELNRQQEAALRIQRVHRGNSSRQDTIRLIKAEATARASRAAKRAEMHQARIRLTRARGKYTSRPQGEHRQRIIGIYA
eukprot:SAG31_NODE_6110_length_2167_cov_1.224371_1_plen_684_part_01